MQQREHPIPVGSSPLEQRKANRSETAAPAKARLVDSHYLGIEVDDANRHSEQVDV
jgi:hypothetical protein